MVSCSVQPPPPYPLPPLSKSFGIERAVVKAILWFSGGFRFVAWRRRGDKEIFKGAPDRHIF